MTTRVRKIHQLVILVTVVLLLIAAPGILNAADPATLLPRNIEIGMSRSALLAVEPALRELDPPLSFGPVQAEFIDTSIERLGAPGTLFIQLDPQGGRLRQLLFDWRDARVSPGRAAAMLEQLERHLGTPDQACFTAARQGKPPLQVSARWRGAAVVLHVSMFDHREAGIAYFDPNSDSDPRRPSFERRRITRRSLPRRMVVRIHGVEDDALAPRQECPEGSTPGS
jgi:hypothetical protein